MQQWLMNAISIKWQVNVCRKLAAMLTSCSQGCLRQVCSNNCGKFAANVRRKLFLNGHGNVCCKLAADLICMVKCLLQACGKFAACLNCSNAFLSWNKILSFAYVCSQLYSNVCRKLAASIRSKPIFSVRVVYFSLERSELVFCFTMHILPSLICSSPFDSISLASYIADLRRSAKSMNFPSQMFCLSIGGMTPTIGSKVVIV